MRLGYLSRILPPILPFCPTATSAATFAPVSAKSWTATGGNAASGRTGEANMSPWPMATPPAFILTPLKKSRSFMFFPAPVCIPSPPPAANLHCKFCQNWEISQVRPEETYNFDLAPRPSSRPPRKRAAQHSPHLCGTHGLLRGTCWRSPRLSKAPGLINVCHSAGYINPKPLEELCPHIQAACVDSKALLTNFIKNW